MKAPDKIYIQTNAGEAFSSKWTTTPLKDFENTEYIRKDAIKDLTLTIQDLELLHTFLYAVKNNKHGCFTFTRLSDEQYAEVLKRFKEAKKWLNYEK